MEKRKTETLAVKKALRKAGFDNLSVSHGRGTAYGWLEIDGTITHSPDCACTYDPWGTRNTGESCGNKWRETHDKIKTIVKQATGRTGEYDGNVMVQLSFR